jgi:hypothetical protein
LVRDRHKPDSTRPLPAVRFRGERGRTVAVCVSSKTFAVDLDVLPGDEARAGTARAALPRRAVIVCFASRVLRRRQKRLLCRVGIDQAGIQSVDCATIAPVAFSPLPQSVETGLSNHVHCA